ncbi:MULTISPECIES: Bug family tripartite tricarboxylate transporter substrate binding protein [Hydrogenophaga]|uniref:Bug family tripartite tricarboxylate transporter substrate binding protein n=1 Tax=Hydrogenophaga TaxID=47420 RepID=UPI001CF990D9|nr:MULTISPECIES: tripartite tricarboxylate transporter substrate binding protein [Hydrogenophaga]MDO9030465.1 tripartite tricarboxylate transporter substrate binding protein [Hydrogenophaga sp.]UCU95284.1 tripartite tricarboxylate transporter substrate binding protein [Hydrogenophaga taeniospiralis]
MRNILKNLSVLTLGSLAFGAVLAADAPWPDHPIKLIVPFTAGGVTDNTSRLLAKLLEPHLGQPVIVENRPGAGGSIGVEAAARQAPDGYTMVYGTQGTQGANLALYKKVGYDPVADFAPVHGISESPLVLVINPNRPFKSVPELIAYAKANPGKLNYGSAGAGTGTHLTAEMFQVVTGTKMTHVAYKGSSPALTDLMAGSIDVMFDYPAIVLPLVNGKKLTALAVTAKKRLTSAPDVPVISEFGLAGAESSSWGAVFMPAKTPPAIVKKMADAIEKAMVEPEMVKNNQKYGSIPMTDMRDQKLGEFVRTEMVRWRDLVKTSGASLE